MQPDSYERAAAAFDFFSRPPLTAPRVRLFLESAARLLPPSACVCDAGGGSGVWAEILLEARPDLRLTLVEPSPPMLAIARQRLPASVAFVPGTIQEALPGLPPQDAFFFLRSLYAMEADAAGYERLFRALQARIRPDGFVCILDVRRPIDVAASEAYFSTRCAELGLSAEFARHWEEYRRRQDEYNAELGAGRIGVLDHLELDTLLQNLHFQKLVLTPDIQVYQYIPPGRTVNAGADLCEYQCFSHEGQHYLLNVETVAAFRISEPLARRLEELRREPGAEIRDEALLRALMALELVRQPGQGAPPESPRGIGHLVLNISQDCNLACTYCYGDRGEYGRRSLMDETTALGAIDWLIENSGDIVELRVAFFGGEPLLSFELMRTVIGYGRERAAAVGKTIVFGTTTNATLLTEERVRYLKSENVQVNISYDGILQDAQRRFRNGAPTAAKVRAAAALLARYYGSEFRVSSTVSQPVDLDAMELDLDDIGCGRSFIRAASPLYGEDTSPLLDAVSACFVQHVDGLVEENLTRIRRRQPPRGAVFKKVLGLLLRRGRLTHFCGAGRGLAAVATNGEVYPCHRFNGMEAFRMGTLGQFDPASCEPYRQATVDRQPVCRDCWARYFCGGGCCYDNRNNPEHEHLPPERCCALFRHTLAAAIRLFAQLEPSDRDFLKTCLREREEVEDPTFY